MKDHINEQIRKLILLIERTSKPSTKLDIEIEKLLPADPEWHQKHRGTDLDNYYRMSAYRHALSYMGSDDYPDEYRPIRFTTSMDTALRFLPTGLKIQTIEYTEAKYSNYPGHYRDGWLVTLRGDHTAKPGFHKSSMELAVVIAALRVYETGVTLPKFY